MVATACRANRVCQSAGYDRRGVAMRRPIVHAFTSSSARVAQTLSTSSTLVMPAMA